MGSVHASFDWRYAQIFLTSSRLFFDQIAQYINVIVY